jgi:DNA modification methylase
MSGITRGANFSNGRFGSHPLSASDECAFLRDLKIELRSLTDIKANPRNARTHSKRQIRAIAESIRVFGFTSPVLIDEDDVILAGHGRVEAAKLLGLHRVPTIRISELSESQKRALVLAENKLAERAGWDRELLSIELAELSTVLPDIGLTVQLTGFEIAEVDTILSDVEEKRAASTDDEVVTIPDRLVSQPGDLWLLGKHRILCGDARDAAVFEMLLGSERVDMMFADPPYNVRIVGHARSRSRKLHTDFVMASGEMSEQQFTAFLHQILKNAASYSHNGTLHYVCIDWRHIGELLTAGRTVYGSPKNVIVWVKNNGGQGSLYRSQHELIGLFKVGDGEHVNNIELGRFGRNRSNVWTYAGVNTFKAGRQLELDIHPTVKPVALVADAIKDVTGRNAIVLDPFGGSGTTVIAAERTCRRARLIEIDPRYVDATITRFEHLTGTDAVHANSGRTFAELAAERAGGLVR